MVTESKLKEGICYGLFKKKILGEGLTQTFNTPPPLFSFVTEMYLPQTPAQRKKYIIWCPNFSYIFP